jgi:hypothetical protein
MGDVIPVFRMHGAWLGLASALLLPCAARVEAIAAPVQVTGNRVYPNAFEPALPCTLTLLAPGDHLLGPGLRLLAEPAAKPDVAGNYAFLPFGADDFLFDQVNVFWHAQRYLERLRGYGLDPEEIPILVHVARQIGSFTHPTEANTTIGTGVGTTARDAKDGDVIVHEITHAVFNPRMPGRAYPLDKGEGQATSEGLADYFAAAVHGDTKIGEYSVPPNGFYDLITDPAVYNYSRWNLLPGDPYSLGRVLNGALLEARGAIGEVMDELVFASLAHHPLRCLTCVADAVRWADVERYGGAHLTVLDAAFARRGIPSGPPANVAIAVPSYAWTGESIRVALQHDCGAGPFTVDWDLIPVVGVPVRLAERGDAVTIEPAAPFELQATLHDRLGGTTVVRSPRVQTYDPNDPAYRVPGVRIVGPRGFFVGKPQLFSYGLTGGAGIRPVRATWTIRDAAFDRLTDATATVIVTNGRAHPRLTLTYSDAAGQAASDTITLLPYSPLSVALTGPDAVAPGQTAIFRAVQVTGVPPFSFNWRQSSAGFSYGLSSGDTAVSAPSGADFDIVFSVTDALGSRIDRTRHVAVLPTVGGDLPAGRVRVFRVLGTVVARGTSASFELPAGDDAATLEFIDVAGRSRWRAALPAPAPAVYKAPLPGTLEPGLYYARWRQGAAARVARFVVVAR